MDWAILAVAAATLIASGAAVWYARRAESRAGDRSDVYWRVERLAVDKFQVRNCGQDAAVDTRCVLIVAGSRYVESTSLVASDECVLFDAPAGLAAHRESKARRTMLPLGTGIPDRIAVELHVTWRSPHGRWSQQNSEEWMSAERG